MAAWPWYGAVVRGEAYKAAEFLSVHEYEHVQRWVAQIGGRPAAKRGTRVNRSWGDASERLRERHSASDFEQRS
jgi:GST-like protein